MRSADTEHRDGQPRKPVAYLSPGLSRIREAARRDKTVRFMVEGTPQGAVISPLLRYAAERRAKRGLGKPETFDFLGFTHISGRSRNNGRFLLKRKTSRKRLHAKMKDIRRLLQWHRHKPISEQGAWLRMVLQGASTIMAFRVTARR